MDSKSQEGHSSGTFKSLIDDALQRARDQFDRLEAHLLSRQLASEPTGCTSFEKSNAAPDDA